MNVSTVPAVHLFILQFPTPIIPPLLRCTRSFLTGIVTSIEPYGLQFICFRCYRSFISPWILLFLITIEPIITPRHGTQTWCSAFTIATIDGTRLGHGHAPNPSGYCFRERMKTFRSWARRMPLWRRYARYICCVSSTDLCSKAHTSIGSLCFLSYARWRSWYIICKGHERTLGYWTTHLLAMIWWFCNFRKWP